MDEKERQLSALQMATQLGFTIAVPLVVLALAGRFADQYFGTHPWLLLAGIVLSMVTSSILVTWKAFKLMAGVTKKTQEKEKTTNNHSENARPDR